MSLAFSAEIPSADFVALVKRAAAVQSRNAIPILEHALLKGDGKTLSVSSTNLDQAVTSRIDCEARGACTASMPRLAAIAGTLEKGVPVQLAVNGTGELTVRHGRSRYTMPTLPPDDFPASAEIDGTRLRAPSSDLLRSLFDLGGAIDTKNPAQAFLAGVFFDTRNNALAATNGYVLGRDAAPWCVADRDGFTLPSSSHAAVRDIAHLGEHVEIVADESSATFSAGNVRVWSKFIGTKFVDYLNAIPRHFTSKWSIRAADLSRALKQIALISKGDEWGVSIRCEFGDSDISFLARDTDGATAEASVPCERKSGSDLTIGFGARNIRWAVDALDGEPEIELHANGPTNAVILTPAGDMNSIRLATPQRVR